MRLIDADALKEYLIDEYECDAYHDNDDDWSAGRASAWWAAQVHVDDMPTIDAIPVEWLWKTSERVLNTTGQKLVDALIERWQKEQEAQDG